MKKQVKIALVKGNSRYENILNSLNLIKTDILEKTKNKHNIIIKPNCVSDSVQLASTHADAIKAVLDFLPPKKITIAEGSAYKTEHAFENFNYYSLKENYNIKFKDLNEDKYKEIYIYDKNFNPLKIGISETMLDSDCIISLTIPKTHDSAIITAGIKNVAVGSLIKTTWFPYRTEPQALRKIVNRLTSIRNDKVKIHQGPKAIHKNIFEIYKKIKPSISIIDGFEAMEGNGPIDGNLVKMNLAIAGTNPIATDIITAKLMGLNSKEIGYLNYIIDYEKFNLKKIKIFGNTTIAKEKRKFKMHETYPKQINWRI